MIEIVISSDAHALVAAEQAKDLAKNIGFSEVNQTKIAIATSELAKNIVIHAEGRGRVVIKPIIEHHKTGIEVIAEDSGPGIADMEKALQGDGLSGVKRLMDEFEIETKVGEGTKITVKKWKI